MKIPKHAPSKTPFVIAGVVLVLLLAGGIYWWLGRPGANQATPNNSPRPQNTVDYGPATEAEKKEGQDIKKEAIEGTQNPPSQDISVTISQVRQVEQSVLIRSIVSGAVSGTCEATFSLDGQANVTETIAMRAEATTVICNAEVPTSKFPANGEWTLSLIAKSGSSQSVAATQKVTITK